MYLKNLTVFGFKSFADKTALNFQPGVTAIVGPNGCGKSNVSDAVRWVLGEQSAKALRGGEMADVIFNGTDGRKPLGMAEVSLTIGGVDEDHLRAAGVEVAYNEVTITRRVFRDGGSEYYINKTPCRLKDVQQLFMGTGVGRTSYSIMAQGNITQILSSKPEDRRMIFEEAAGITKYKSQKKEALRKLEYTDQNLLRVEDLIREVKRQIGSLQRQAGKARRYKTLMLELQHLDTQLARHQFDILQTEINERLSQAEKLRSEIEDISSVVLRREDEITQLRDQLSALEHQIGAMQQRGLELKGQIDRHESRIHFNDERLREIAAQNTKALADISQAEERHLAAGQELTALIGRLEASQNALEHHREGLLAKQQALQTVEADLRSLQEAQREAQSEAFAQAQQLTRARNEITALDFQKQGNVVRLEKLSAEKIQLEVERGDLESRLTEFTASVETEKLNVQTQRGTMEERQQRLRDIQHELAGLTQDLDARLQQQAEQRSRLSVLAQLQAEHEGFGAGALAALSGAGQVLGSLADKIRVPDQHITAVEAALGHHLQLVIAEQPETAQQILADLSANKKGRASIASLALGISPDPRSAPVPGGGNDHISNATPSVSASTPAHDESSVAFGSGQQTPEPPPGFGSLLSVVEADPSVRPLLQRLLGRTLIAPGLDSATAAWRASSGAFDFVTPSGELLSRHGVFTGGSVNGSGRAPGSILGRRNQIAELESHLGRGQEEVHEMSRHKGALLSEQTALQAGLQQAQSDLRVQEVAIATHQGECNALQNSQKLLHQKIDTVVYEIQSLAAQEQEGREKRAVLARQAAELESHERVLQQRASETALALEELRQKRDHSTAALTETKVAVASEEQICASFGQQRQALDQRLHELSQLVGQRRSEISGFLARQSQAESEIQESRRQIGTLDHEREQVNAQTAELAGQKSGQESDIMTREEDLREQRRRLAACQERRGAIEVELAQKTMGLQNLRERVQQKYHVNLDDIRSECITITFADEGAPKIHTLTPEEMAASGAATDWNAVGEQVASLQTRIDEMGPVNLVAIEEYEETEQRHAFLTAQHDDLVTAKAQLLEVINRINLQTRQMFTETFEKIRDNFRAMFTEVFGGGKADLLLVGDGDALESGIDIVARPPGKQLQTISLLSGGEQTMTAVALLFSIYQVKPSPFCVLDELDAPLDEANINRFIRVLQRFLAHSQFIVITHNKRTIGMADVLYGVTMEEHGISKIVSVKFHKAEEPATDQRGNPLVPPANGDAQLEAAEDTARKREDTVDIAMAQ
jgi:chromosome segregation protein